MRQTNEDRSRTKLGKQLQQERSSSGRRNGTKESLAPRKAATAANQMHVRTPDMCTSSHTIRYTHTQAHVTHTSHTRTHRDNSLHPHDLLSNARGKRSKRALEASTEGCEEGKGRRRQTSRERVREELQLCGQIQGPSSDRHVGARGKRWN